MLIQFALKPQLLYISFVPREIFVTEEMWYVHTETLDQKNLLWDAIIKLEYSSISFKVWINNCNKNFKSYFNT